MCSKFYRLNALCLLVSGRFELIYLLKLPKMKLFVLFLSLAISLNSYSQKCDCEKEFLYIQNIIEQNYAGFVDKINILTKESYLKRTKELQQITKRKFNTTDCIYIIKNYLDQFKEKHIQFSLTQDTIKRNSFPFQLATYPLSEKKIRLLQKSTGFEGIYYFRYDSSFKIAVVKDKSPVHDYIAVILESKYANWKKGLIRWEGKLVNDTFLIAAKYWPPSIGFDGLDLTENRLGNDWVRVGSPKHIPKSPQPPPSYKVAQKLTENTFYVRISSFDPSYAHDIDSILKSNDEIISRTLNLILDLRNNGGGSDFSYEPLIKYIYSSPFKTVGVDVFATDLNIAGWKEALNNKDIPEENKNEIREKIAIMEKNKGRLVNIYNDDIDSSYNPVSFPQKVAILINKRSASTTEQFLLMAKQSSKVFLLGENSQGTLDYSNMRQIQFSCFPYDLYYATTRSRRLNISQGIDNVGVAPHYYLNKDSDWVHETLKILEK